MSKGYGIHIGLNYVNPKYYDGDWDGKLSFCVKDAEAMEALVTKEKYHQTIPLYNENATRENVGRALVDMSKTCQPEDILVLTYSGHGGSLPDKNGDEEDRVDETWCLYNGHMIDDELNNLYALFQEGVRIFVISDSCHSGTVSRIQSNRIDELFTRMIKESGLIQKSMTGHQARISYLKNKAYYDAILNANKRDLSDVKASVKLLSGCQDNQKSYEGWGHGVLTERVMEVWDKGRYRGNYARFHQRIVAEMPDYQSPNLFDTGKKNPAFDAQKPFEI